MDDNGTIGCIGCIGCLWFFGIITGNTAMILVLLAIILWMEKLIELLNEYCVGAFVYDNDILRFRLGDRAKIEGNAILISKSFGFIKWLVENDKINFNGLPNIFTSIYANERDDIYYEIKRNNYSVLTEQYGVNLTDRLLMLLSISNTPIEDLLLYLK